MPDKYKNFRGGTARLQGYDYSSNGAYFITICTKHRTHYFGEIIDGGESQNIAILQPTEIGKIAHSNWLQIPIHFPFTFLDEFIIMPNHVHGIIFIDKIVDPKNFSFNKNKFAPQSGNLASIIRGYKASVKTFATKHNIDFCWQPRYYERIIRNNIELEKIRKYIQSNPVNWQLNKNNVENLFM